MNITEYQNYQELKSHTITDFPYNTYLCSIPLDFTHVPLHWHDEAELIAIKRGRGKVSLDLNSFEVQAGDLIVILPGRLHSIEQIDQEHMEYENILFMPSLLDNTPNDLCYTKFLSAVFDGKTNIDLFLTPALSYYPDIQKWIASLDDICSRRPDGYQLMIKSHLYSLFFLLISHQKSDSAPVHRAKSLEKLKQVIKYVEEHYAEPISIEEMAQLTFYSTSHFMKFFKTNMGTGFTAYLNHYRLTIAARLLSASSATVLEIAGKTGFENLSYFNRLFRRRYHMTPSEYRRQSKSLSPENISDPGYDTKNTQ